MIVIRMDGPLVDEVTADRIEAEFEKMPFHALLIFERSTAECSRAHFQVRGPRRLLDRHLFTGPVEHGETVLEAIARTLLRTTIGYPVEPIYTEEWLTQTTHPFPVMW